jgi:hypothetical protein
MYGRIGRAQFKKIAKLRIFTEQKLSNKLQTVKCKHLHKQPFYMQIKYTKILNADHLIGKKMSE